MATSGEDSLLVYTYENVLLHYVFVSSSKTVKIAQVGQIAFHGIIRAPPRVRAISWILPEEQRGMYLTRLTASHVLILSQTTETLRMTLLLPPSCSW